MTHWLDDNTDAAWHQQELEQQLERKLTLDMNQFVGTSESKYLKAADLQGKTVPATISGVSIAEFEDDEGKKSTRPALSLEGKKKQVVCNPTSVNKLIQAFGSESEKWIGGKITLHSEHYPKIGKDGIVITPIRPVDPNDDLNF